MACGATQFTVSLASAGMAPVILLAARQTKSAGDAPATQKSWQDRVDLENESLPRPAGFPLLRFSLPLPGNQNRAGGRLPSGYHSASGENGLQFPRFSQFRGSPATRLC
jgi:hypothetical protein